MSSNPPDRPNPKGGERNTMVERLREAREYLGFSQDEVARYLGIARSALSNIETGQRKVDALELKKLAALYKQPVAYFTGDDEPASSDAVSFLMRAASGLSEEDREELGRFADYLRSRKQSKEP